tara:strand:- start:159 stop:818 length:660 start_codon:yes stop_codon:yes gene_type:complete
MDSAKSIIIKPVSAKAANNLIRRIHYSGKIVQNSSLHFGVYLNGALLGAMQFGSCMDKHRMRGLVSGTGWNEFIELNRMAFSDYLPRFSESRALSVAFRLIKKHYPHLKWVISFSDATQCGDGAIYRASGFDLVGIKKNASLLRMPDGSVKARKTLDNSSHPEGQSGWWLKNGAKPLEGFQIKYIFFLDKSCKANLTSPILPFSAIEAAGASMYKGKKA